MNKIFLGFTVLFFFSTCAEKKENTLYEIKRFSDEDIPITKHLIGEKIKVKGMVYPRVILNLQDYLVVGEHRADTMLHVIEKKSMEIINKVGVLGRGPGEIGISRHLFSTDSANEFWVYQAEVKKVDRFTIPIGHVFSEETIPLRDKLTYTANFAFSSDSTYMTILVDGNEKFVEFNKNGEIINTYDTWDHMLDGDLPYNVISSIHQGMLNVSRDNQYYTLASIGLDRIEVLNRNTGKVTSIRGPINHIPKFTVDYSPGYPMPLLDDKTAIYTYLNTVSGKTSFYALFSGVASIEVNRGADKFCNTIMVFDYEGNVEARYILDTSLCYMALDEDARKIYGLTFNGDEIVVFDF